MSKKQQLLSRFHNMKSRCYRTAHHNYKHYGGRGITICPGWLKNPQAFVDWALENAWTPELEIDRINNDGPYSPENCRFVTHKANVRNSRASKLTIPDIKGIKFLLGHTTLTHKDIAFKFDVDRATVTNIGRGHRHATV